MVGAIRRYRVTGLDQLSLQQHVTPRLAAAAKRDSTPVGAGVGR